MQDNLWEEQLALTMRRTLTPTHPSDSFRKHLRANLQLAGQQQATRRALRMRQPQPVNYWVLGAAALGLTVAAGSMIAWAIRARAPLR
ncbi:MAG: hypothetical protein BroJett039_00680 [Chloroflexota bacterium]|nr:MAG: hypothetical protein BroJett039_00680 [Chloroflexota bacterium]